MRVHQVSSGCPSGSSGFALRCGFASGFFCKLAGSSGLVFLANVLRNKLMNTDIQYFCVERTVMHKMHEKDQYFSVERTGTYGNAQDAQERSRFFCRTYRNAQTVRESRCKRLAHVLPLHALHTIRTIAMFPCRLAQYVGPDFF